MSAWPKRATIRGAAVALALATFATAPLAAQDTLLQRLTPILYVEAIEPVLPFWTERLEFSVTGQVEEGDALGFVMMERDGVQVMLQTRESVANDVPAIEDTPMGGTILFIEVADLDDIIRRLDGVEVVVPERTTEYGAREIFVREPGGNIVGFAEFGAGGDEDG